MSTEAPARLPGYPVSLPDIEAELTAFWQGEAKDAEDEAVIRATTLNLIIIVENDSLFQRAIRAVPHLAPHHPCRIILAFVNPQKTSGQIDASFSAFCQLSLLSGKQICCEQINLDVPAQGKNDLPGDILPLLLPSLPVYLWWPNQSFFTMEDFPGLYQAIDRIILDIPEIFLSAKSLASFVDQVIRLSTDMKVSDMGWARITSWREAIAQFFDSPSNGESLMQLNHILCSQTVENISSSAFLLAGWLISSLEWGPTKKEQNNKGDFRFRNPHGKETRLRILTEPSEDLAGLSAIELCSDAQDQIRFLAALRQVDFIETEVWRSQALLHQSRQPISRLDDGRLLCNELDYLQTDLVYLQTLKTIRELLQDSSP